MIAAGQTALAADFISTSAGASDAGRVAKVNSIGKLDSSFFVSNSTTAVFTSTGTWTRPNGCVRVKVRLVGAGGGGFSSGATKGCAGGGTGAYAERIIDVSGTTSVIITIGAAGAANTAGGATKFADASSPLYVTAGGGSPGTGQDDNVGAGGTASGGDVNITGGNGHPGNRATGVEWGGHGGSSFFGGQGAPGSGGQGGNGGSASPGTIGLAIIEQYFY